MYILTVIGNSSNVAFVKRMPILLIIAVLYIQPSQCVKAVPGHPVPHAEVLDQLFSKFLGSSYSDTALFNYILGQPGDVMDANLTTDNLGIKVLDVQNVRKIIEYARKKHSEVQPQRNESRRLMAYNWHPYTVKKSMELMLQTIYFTKERVNTTYKHREKFSKYPSYKIAVLYGAASAILGKMESLLAQMKHLWWKTHFLWYLILYEKILACNIDISDAIEHIFLVQRQFTIVRGPKPKPEKEINLSKLKGKPGMPDDALQHAMQQEG